MNAAGIKEDPPFIHPRSTAREQGLCFLYQCECEKIFYFSENHFLGFAEYFNLDRKTAAMTRELVRPVLDDLSHIDRVIEGAARNWSVPRMPATDRCVLRLACSELLQKKMPVKVVINEAIDLARRYGTGESGSFVNGILDRVASAR